MKKQKLHENSVMLNVLSCTSRKYHMHITIMENIVLHCDTETIPFPLLITKVYKNYKNYNVAILILTVTDCPSSTTIHIDVPHCFVLIPSQFFLFISIIFFTSSLYSYGNDATRHYNTIFYNRPSQRLLTTSHDD